MHRARYFFPASLLSALLATAVQAATIPGLYTAIVPVSDSDQAAQDALRSVLVRLTGSRTAASEPMFAELIGAARRYVQVERATTGGQTQVLFDAGLLDAAIEAAGGHVWDTDRPLVWVSLPAAAPGVAASADELRTRLSVEAQVRGLPLLFSAESAGAGAGLDTARHAGAAAALTAAPTTDGQGLQWTLVSPAASGQWSGTPEAAIDSAVDTLANAARTLAEAPVAQFDCRIDGVADLPSFTDVLGTVSDTPGVQQVAVPEIAGDTLTLHVTARGTAATLAHALRGERLQALNTGGDALDYRYQRAP